jgi:hypothetical protein
MNIQKDLKDWLGDYNFSYFLTIKLPLNMRTDDLFIATMTLRRIMKTFEKVLIGSHWHRRPLHFISFAEQHKSEEWHFHILFKKTEIPLDKIQTAIIKTHTNMSLDNCSLLLDPIDHTPDRVNSYCIKDIKADAKYHVDTDRLIPSHVLFDLPVKQK